MDLSNFDFDLPNRLIALRPVRPRSSAKLLFYCNRLIKDYNFLNLPDLFQEHASQNEQLTEAKLDVNGIYNKIKLDIETQKIKFKDQKRS